MAYEVLYFDMPLCLNRRLPQNTNTHQSVAALNCVNFIPDQDEDAVWPGIKKLPTPDLIPVHCDQSDGLSVTESLQSSNFSDEIDPLCKANIPVANGVVHLIKRPLIIVALNLWNYLQNEVR